MQLAFISTMCGSPWGGSEELWSQAALRLQGQGHKIGACVEFWEPLHPKISRLRDAGVDLHLRRPVHFSLPQRIGRKLLRKPWVDLTEQRAKEWLLNMKPDLVCISQGASTDGLEWMTYCRDQAIPYITVAQANYEWFWPKDRVADELAVCSRSARACFFVSKSNRLLFEDQIGEELVNAQIVRNPFNVSWDAQTSWPSESPDWHLACVGRLEPASKGQDLLLRVLAQDKWRQRNLKVNFYGTGDCEHSVRKLAARFALTSVNFKGYTNSIVHIWQENHALILPSRMEGLPLAIVEAMLCSRMAIVTDVAGNAELLEDGVTGFIAEAPTVSLLDQAMETAWERRSQWQALGVTARQKVQTSVPPDPVAVFCEQLLTLAP